MSKFSKMLMNPKQFFIDSKIYEAVAKNKKKKELKHRRKGKNYDVVVYFYGGISSLYQLKQWLPVFSYLAKELSLAFVVRSEEVYIYLQKEFNFYFFYCRYIGDVTSFYEENNVSCVLYVNNGMKNFQSLITSKSLHVHINHGESDKSSMHSNQAKAYDYVFCVADAGVDRYKKNLLKFDKNKFLKVGRPQLDFVEESSLLIPKNIKVVLYAPTWAATHKFMNYSSVASYGFEVATRTIEAGFFLIYKPHPAVGTTCRQEKEAHEMILKLISKNTNMSYFFEGDVNSVFSKVDLAIFDNSSVIIDYLHYNKPFFATNFYKKHENIPAYIKSARLLGKNDYKQIGAVIKNEINNDRYINQRLKVKKYYLGAHDKGGSTKCFVNTINKVINERNSLVDIK